MATYPERYDHIDFSVPEGVQDAFQRGLDLVAEGFGGDGLEEQTLREARSLAAGEGPTVDKLRKMYRFWTRNERFLDDDDKTSPAWVSAMLWGGRPGMAWSRSLVEQMDAADREAGVGSERTNNARADERSILIYPRGKFIKHKAGDFEVTQDFITSMLHAFRVFEARYGYYPPILQQHSEDGFTYGLVANLLEDERGLWAVVQFAKGMAQKYDDGYMTNWSPSHYPSFTPSDSDEEYRWVLAELSFVSLQHMLDITAPSAHYDLPVRMSRAEFQAMASQVDNEREEDMEEELQALRELLDAKFDELSGRLDALEARDDETEDNAADGGDEVEMKKQENEATQNAAAIEHQRELVKMSREIAELKRERDMDRLRIEHPGITAEDASMLVSMSAEQRTFALGLMKQARTSSQQQVSSPGVTTNASAAPAGQFRTMCERAKKNGATAANLLTHLIEREGVSLDQYSELYDEAAFRSVFEV